MATVNEQAYGSKDLWYSIPYGSTQFPPSTTIEERNTLANFTDTIPSSIDWHLWLGRVIYEVEVNNNQALKDLFYNTVFDRSICFVGQSGKSSYTSIRFFDNQGTDAQNPDVRELPTQTYDVVNLAFNYGLGSMRDYDNGVRRWEVIGADIDKDPSANALKFDAIRWCPLGWAGIKGTDYYYTDYGNRYRTTFVTNMSTKRNVLVPYVKAGTTDTSDTNAIGTYDLATYLSTYKDTKPYVYSIGFETTVMYGDSIEASPSNPRTSDFGYGLMLMEYISSLNDFYYIGPNNGWQTAHYNNDLFVPQILKSPHMPLGGYINNGSYSEDTPSALGYESTLNSVGVHVVIDCNDIKWDTWVNIGSSTAEGTCNKILVADARKYSADDFREAVRSSLACFGMFFTDDSEVASSGKLDDPAMHLGTLKNGIGYGDYTSGSDNKNQPQWTWTSMSDNEYDPSKPIPADPNTYNGSMGTSIVLSFATATTRYNIRTNDFITLTDKLWDAMALATPDNIANYSLDTFLTSNPIDSIVNIKWFPIKESMSIGKAINVKLGKYDTGISAYVAQISILKDCGNVVIYPVSGHGVANWIDKLTKITLYLPFCGSLNLDPETYMGRSVNVEYAIDLITGACSAYVSYIADNGQRVITDIASGTCGIDCPVTGIQHATLDSQLYNATEQLKAMRVNNAINGLSSVLGLSDVTNKGIGGISDALKTGGTIYNALQNESVADYNLHHTQTPIKMIGTSSAMTGAMCDLRPTIIFERPVIPPIDDNAYAHVCGYACCEPTTIGNLSGYAEFASVDLSGFEATAEEKNMIVNALMGGVYL